MSCTNYKENAVNKSKWLSLVVVAGLICTTAGVSYQASGQDDKDASKSKVKMPEPPQMDMSPEQMMAAMKKWIETTTPGDGHKRLDYFVGEWDTTTKIWMAGPGMPPTETKGKAVHTWVLGGRFLQHEARGEMIFPTADGQMTTVPHEGFGLSGYDKSRNVYTLLWVDNLNTHMLTGVGNIDPTGRIFTYYGLADEAMLGVYGRYVKYTVRIINESKYLFEVADLHVSDDFKVVEVTYTRKK